MKIFFTKSVSVFVLVILSVSLAHAEVTDVNLTIRDGENIIFSGAVPFPVSGTVDLSDVNGVSHTINAQSVLAIVNNADLGDEGWSISNLTFFDSFGSFYIKCINYSGGEKCDNWQYIVNNLFPSSGVDQNILSGGENVYVFFGPQYRVVLDSNEITTANTLIVTAEKYNYEDNSWKTRTEVTVGLTQPNPDDPWSPIEILTGAANENGQVNFSSIPEGVYNVGIKEDFYFPTETLTVKPFSVPDPVPESSSGSGGRSKRSGSVLGAAIKAEFDLEKAFEFIISQQKENGSFGEDIFTDWVAIAYGAMNATNGSRDALLNYFNSQNFTGSLLTDNERHAMALLSLGQNPYSFGGINYIDLITNSFDGAQFGDISLINDDIFALIPLASAGYTKDDDIIAKDIAFILSKQKSRGSWEGSVDLTAAAVQALGPFESAPGVSDALLKARTYLEDMQGNDGGWNSVYSTSWAMQAMSVLGASWVENGRTPNDYLSQQQMEDGAILPKTETLQNRIWATSYAIPAVLGKPWSAIMHSVAKPIQENNDSEITEKVGNINNQIVKMKSEIKPKEVGKKNLKNIFPQVGTDTNLAPQVLLASAEESKSNIPPSIIVGGVTIFLGIIMLFLLKFII